MPSRTDLNEHLEELEQELGQTLRAALGGHEVRREFAASLREELASLPLSARQRRLWLVPARAWAALAALLVVGLAVGGATLFVAGPEAAQAEALGR